MKKALFAGSFDPFTLGHLDMVRKCCELFDKVYVMIGYNINKKRMFSPDSMQNAISHTLEADGLTNCEVVCFDGLLVDFAEKNGIKYIVRGLRNTADYQYEEGMAQVNTLLSPGIEYIYLRSEQGAVSSSMVRELISHGRDVSQFVPREILSEAVRCEK